VQIHDAKLEKKYWPRVLISTIGRKLLYEIHRVLKIIENPWRFSPEPKIFPESGMANGKPWYNGQSTRAEIHQALLLEFSCLAEFFIVKVTVKNKDRIVLKLVNLNHELLRAGVNYWTKLPVKYIQSGPEVPMSAEACPLKGWSDSK
jgi:hypothetical protein